MAAIESRTIVFITGAFVSHLGWNDWCIFFEDNGYYTLAPPWLGKDADAVTLRSRHPDRTLAMVTLPALISYYAGIVKNLPEKPILIGHSFGGLIAQVLLNQGHAAACVAIHAAPPPGVIPYELNFFKSNTQALGYFTPLDETYLMSFEKWQFVFTNGMSFEDQKNAYYAAAIPESKRVIRGGLTRAAHVDFKTPHAPLLFLAGAQDHCIPAHLCERVFRKYADKNSVRDYAMKDRNHYVTGLPTWEEDAAFILRWINKHQTSSRMI